VDFTEFLNIKGCTLAKHSNVKPPEPEKPVKDDSDKDEVVEVRAPIREALPRPPIATPLTVLQPTVAPALKEIVFATKTPVAQKSSDSIEVGTSCKNNGCTYSFAGTSNDFGECTYHPGVPIFHEGLKFWSCCQKRTSDFAQFMAQKGCAYGQHKWVKEVGTFELLRESNLIFCTALSERRQKGCAVQVRLAPDGHQCGSGHLCQEI